MTKDTDLIKEKIDLAEFLRGYLALHPAGKNFKALCPFHQEKTPSFVVSPDRKIWHCFGCGEGGDIIKFAMRYENLEFPEALRFLAERAGLEIRTNPQEQKEFGVLYDLHEASKNFYRENLKKRKDALNYLEGRGLSGETMQSFELGFAPGGDSLVLHLLKSGFDVADIARAGLAHKNVSGLYRDRFQARIIFPIYNSVGKVIAFTGRLLPTPAPEVKDIPKYLNSPETPIFNKSKVLYGLNRTKQEVARAKSVFVVEGQMDLLAVWQSGIKNIVAVSGTGLTSYHLERLRRIADEVFLTFDNDAAGMKALERSLDIFNNFDFHVRVVNLGNYKDPAEAVQGNGSFFVDAAKNAKPAFNHLFDFYFSAGFGTDLAAKKRAIRFLLSKIRSVKSAVEEESWLKELSRASGVSYPSLLKELEELPQTGSRGNEEKQAESRREDEVNILASRLMELAFTNDVFLDIVKNNQNLLPGFYRDILLNPKSDSGTRLSMQASYSAKVADKELVDKEFKEILKRLEIILLKKEQGSLRERIRFAESQGADGEIGEAMISFNNLSKRINELNF